MRGLPVLIQFVALSGYQSDKEKHIPYLMRQEMEHTRRRIRTYLCNVFSGYYFDEEWMRSEQAYMQGSCINNVMSMGEE
ncbi:hypothetical protein SAMN04489802_4410 [Pseudomonas chlororaphis]|nr:hypothetical protein C4K17_2098 [Pseudomonas chlororaphis subsp. aurantiaca]AZD72461.1 hypothetical protein C4K16_2101 [Pseudomonas chlororaphis subsp. aurantiaca]BBN54078.1 hypothetical protein TRE132_22030 [Pseudomonas chlororaphis subsp. aurantiaca]SDT42232.1 hypothetical protein SAMN04489802_4410 [Pseudomonas chlororaphis]